MLRRSGLTTRLTLLTIAIVWPTVAACFWTAHQSVAKAHESDRRRKATALARVCEQALVDRGRTVDRIAIADAIDQGLHLGGDAPAPASRDAEMAERAIADTAAQAVEGVLQAARSPRDKGRLREIVTLLLGAHPDLAAVAVYVEDAQHRLDRVCRESKFRDDMPESDIDRAALKTDAAQLIALDRSGVPHLAVAHPFVADGHRYVLHIEIAQPDIALAEYANSEAFVIALIVVTIAVMTLLALSVRQWITRPANLVADAMRSARSSGFMRTLPVTNHEDQFSHLIRTFNEMIFDLRQTAERNRRLVSQLEDSGRNLQRRVEDATADLTTKNAELTTAQEQIYQVQQDVSKLERMASLGHLSSTLAHELSTPLNVVLGHLEMLDHDLTLTGGPRERVKTVTTQVNRLVGILKEMLSMVRLPEPKLAPVSLRALVDETVRFMVPATQSHDIEVVRDLPPTGDLLAMADYQQAQQVVLNLITNAVQATPAGGTLTISVEERPADHRICLRVRDTGPGMQPGELARVFEPFFSTKTPDRGTGLGLSISRDIMERHGGTITAANHPDGGAVFEITFKLAQAGGDAAR